MAKITTQPLNIKPVVDPTGFALYRKKQLAEMRPYILGESTSGVSISAPDFANGSPLVGDMIARNPDNHADVWLVAGAFFNANYEKA